MTVENLLPHGAPPTPQVRRRCEIAHRIVFESVDRTLVLVAPVMSKATWRLVRSCASATGRLSRPRQRLVRRPRDEDRPEFSEAVYGFGSGIFFIGYFLFEVPSNVLLERVGARIWIARIMIVWGIISAGMLLVKSIWQFYLLRSSSAPGRPASSPA